MSGYFLTDGDGGAGNSFLERLYYDLYLPRAENATNWFENNFGNLVGDGFGVRNWFSPSREGDWTKEGNFDNPLVLYAAVLAMYTLIVLVSSIFNNEWVLFAKLIYYFSIFLLGVIFIVTNKVSKKALGEYISFGDASDVSSFIKQSIIITIGYVTLSYLLNSFNPQSITPFDSHILSIFVVPAIEFWFFLVMILPSWVRYIGIIPGVITNTMTITVLHLWALGMFSIPTMILWCVFNLLALKQFKSGVGLIAHMLINLSALLLNSIK